MSARRMAALIGALPSDSAIGRLHKERASGVDKLDASDVTVIRSGEAFAQWMNTTAKKA